MVNGCVIGANFGPCGDRLGDTVREPANFAHPFAAEPTNDSLHLGNEITLQRIERDSRGSEYRVLHEHEDENRQQRAALRDRQRESIADKPADRLQLAGHHRDDLAGRGTIEMMQRKPQYPLVKLIAQAAQHTLADLSLPYVEV